MLAVFFNVSKIFLSMSSVNEGLKVFVILVGQ